MFSLKFLLGPYHYLKFFESVIHWNIGILQNNATNR